MHYLFCISMIGFFMIPLLTQAATLEGWLIDIFIFIDAVIVPFIIILAVFVFIWNAVRFFILENDSDEGKEKAKSLMIWGILGLVLMLIFLGIVDLLVDASGLGRTQYICPDYDPGCHSSAPIPSFPEF